MSQSNMSNRRLKQYKKWQKKMAKVTQVGTAVLLTSSLIMPSPLAVQQVFAEETAVEAPTPSSVEKSSTATRSTSEISALQEVSTSSPEEVFESTLNENIISFTSTTPDQVGNIKERLDWVLTLTVQGDDAFVENPVIRISEVGNFISKTTDKKYTSTLPTPPGWQARTGTGGTKEIYYTGRLTAGTEIKIPYNMISDYRGEVAVTASLEAANQAPISLNLTGRFEAPDYQPVTPHFYKDSQNTYKSTAVTSSLGHNADNITYIARRLNGITTSVSAEVVLDYPTPVTLPDLFGPSEYFVRVTSLDSRFLVGINYETARVTSQMSYERFVNLSSFNKVVRVSVANGQESNLALLENLPLRVEIVDSSGNRVSGAEVYETTLPLAVNDKASPIATDISSGNIFVNIASGASGNYSTSLDYVTLAPKANGSASFSAGFFISKPSGIGRVLLKNVEWTIPAQLDDGYRLSDSIEFSFNFYDSETQNGILWGRKDGNWVEIGPIAGYSNGKYMPTISGFDTFRVEFPEEILSERPSPFSVSLRQSAETIDPVKLLTTQTGILEIEGQASHQTDTRDNAFRYRVATNGERGVTDSMSSTDAMTKFAISPYVYFIDPISFVGHSTQYHDNVIVVDYGRNYPEDFSTTNDPANYGYINWDKLEDFKVFIAVPTGAVFDIGEIMESTGSTMLEGNDFTFLGVEEQNGYTLYYFRPNQAKPIKNVSFFFELPVTLPLFIANLDPVTLNASADVHTGFVFKTNPKYAFRDNMNIPEKFKEEIKASKDYLDVDKDGVIDDFYGGTESGEYTVVANKATLTTSIPAVTTIGDYSKEEGGASYIVNTKDVQAGKQVAIRSTAINTTNGNTPATVVTALPHVGDVLASGNSRGTTAKVSLAGPVTAPEGWEVFYTTDEAAKTTPTADSINWTSTVADYATVTGLKWVSKSAIPFGASSQVHFDYILNTNPSDNSGAQIVTTSYLKTTGGFTEGTASRTTLLAKLSSVTATYKASDLELKSPVVQSDLSVGTTYTTTGDDKITHTDGRIFKLKEVPANATGKVTEAPITVSYEYEEVTSSVTATYKAGDLELKSPVVQSDLSVATDYTTTGDDKIIHTDGRVFKLKAVPANATGKVTEAATTVAYEYEEVKSTVTATYKAGDLELKSPVVQSDLSVATDYVTTGDERIVHTDGRIFKLKEVPANATGKVTEAATTVAYEYEEVKSTVTATYKAGDLELKSPVVQSDLSVGTAYTTTGDDKITHTDGRVFKLKETPTNATGTVSETATTVAYEYEEVTSRVTATYKAGDLELKSPVVQSDLSVGTAYTTTGDDKITHTDGRVFKLKETPGNATGKVTEDLITVPYEYEEVTSKVTTYYRAGKLDLKDPAIQSVLSIGSDYKTQAVQTITLSDGRVFRLKVTPVNATGKVTEDEVVVIYEYEEVKVVTPPSSSDAPPSSGTLPSDQTSGSSTSDTAPSKAVLPSTGEISASWLVGLGGFGLVLLSLFAILKRKKQENDQ